MLIASSNESYLRDMRRSLKQQCDVPSAPLAEAIARGLGFRTNAALRKSEAVSGRYSQYLRFDEQIFSGRLAELCDCAPPKELALPPLGRDARYVEQLLSDPVLEFTELGPWRARFRLVGIATEVEIRLQQMFPTFFLVHRSHAIHTPTQEGPYWPSRPGDDDAGYAMNRAIESLASYYRDAVQDGHTPALDWVVTPLG